MTVRKERAIDSMVGSLQQEVFDRVKEGLEAFRRSAPHNGRHSLNQIRAVKMALTQIHEECQLLEDAFAMDNESFFVKHLEPLYLSVARKAGASEEEKNAGLERLWQALLDLDDGEPLSVERAEARVALQHDVGEGNF